MTQNIRRILAGNWKLYKTRTDVESFFRNCAQPAKNVESYVAASPPLLECAVRESSKNGSSIQILSQNVAFKAEGAFTGEISPKQLVDLGVVGSLVAHSERRQYFGETDKSAAERCKVGLEHGLKIFFCIGESLEDRRHGRFETVVETQLRPLFGVLESFERDWIKEKLVIAYEPVWAIGTGLVANEAEIEASHRYITTLLSKTGFDVPCVYGGSVKPDNLRAIALIPKVSGALVGGASLDAQSYGQLLDCLTRPLRSLNS